MICRLLRPIVLLLLVATAVLVGPKVVKHFARFAPAPVIVALRPPMQTVAVAATLGRETWYVSRNGNNTNGRSWATAWSELDQIAWSSINPGDTVLLDGGATPCASPFNATTTSPYDFPSPKPGVTCGMLYNSTLTVGASGIPGSRITIKLANDAGHDGTVVIFGGRVTSLPDCTQRSYAPTYSGNQLSDGVDMAGNSYLTIDGTKRSGIVIYGAQDGVNFSSTTSGFVTLQNLEIFDNGAYLQGRHGWYSDNPGIWMAGHDLAFSRLLIHDNGQDDIQDQRLYAVGQYNVTVMDSWLYFSRENSLQPGWGFNTGNNEPCMHPDGIQTWSGGTQTNLLVENSIIGPYLGQGIYPSDSGTGAAWNNVTLDNLLFFNVWYDSINASGIPTTNWNMNYLTSYKVGPAPDGVTGAHLDGIRGSAHTLNNSIMANGSNDLQISGMSGAGSIYFNTDPVPGGMETDPQFVSTLANGTPHWSDFQTVNLTAQCPTCASSGSRLHKLQDILTRIDLLNATDQANEAH